MKYTLFLIFISLSSMAAAESFTVNPPSLPKSVRSLVQKERVQNLGESTWHESRKSAFAQLAERGLLLSPLANAQTNSEGRSKGLEVLYGRAGYQELNPRMTLDQAVLDLAKTLPEEIAADFFADYVESLEAFAILQKENFASAQNLRDLTTKILAMQIDLDGEGQTFALELVQNLFSRVLTSEQMREGLMHIAAKLPAGLVDHSNALIDELILTEGRAEEFEAFSERFAASIESLDYDVPEYEMTVTREMLGLFQAYIGAFSAAFDLNPVPALASFLDVGVIFYDKANGGSPEEQRHDELRAYLVSLQEGQKAILDQLQQLGHLIEVAYRKISFQLDGIEHIVRGTQRLVLEQGFKDLRACERFKEAKKHYSDANLQYSNYSSMAKHYEQLELNGEFHSCVNFLRDATFRPEGLSILKVAEDSSQLSELAANLNQSEKWVESQIGKHHNYNKLALSFVKLTIRPEYRKSFLGSMAFSSPTVTSLDEKVLRFTRSKTFTVKWKLL